MFLEYNISRTKEYFMDKNKELNKNNKKVNIDIKNMGVNIDKNEYKEIVLSQSNQPEKSFYDKYRD